MAFFVMLFLLYSIYITTQKANYDILAVFLTFRRRTAFFNRRRIGRNFSSVVNIYGIY